MESQQEKRTTLKLCPKCEILGNGNFCTHCGYSLESSKENIKSIEENILKKSPLQNCCCDPHDQTSNNLQNTSKKSKKDKSNTFPRDKTTETNGNVVAPTETLQRGSIVKLNVGGTLFMTSLSTLVGNGSDHMLAAMFSGRHELKKQEDGSYFIDRDGTHFRYILNYLRGGSKTLPDDKKVISELMEECEFYQLEGLLRALKERFPDELSCSGSQTNIPSNMCIIVEQNTNHNHATIRAGDLRFLEHTFEELANVSPDSKNDVVYRDTFNKSQISLKNFDKMGWFQALYDHRFYLAASAPLFKNTIEYIFHNKQ